MAGQKRWTIRRRIIYLTLIFCAWVINRCLSDKGIETSVATTAITQVTTLATGVILGYVFGATWDDIKNRKVQKELEEQKDDTK